MKVIDEIKEAIRADATSIQLFDKHNINIAIIPVPFAISSFFTYRKLINSPILKMHLHDDVFYKEIVTEPFINAITYKMRLNICAEEGY